MHIIVLNSTLVDWFSKKQATVEAATYGAKFMELKTAVEKIKAWWYTLRMLSVPIDGPCIVFGDNLSVVMNSTDPSSQLKKKHLGITYHLVQEAVAAGIIKIYHIDTKDNLANPLTKAVTLLEGKIIKEMFFYSGQIEND